MRPALDPTGHRVPPTKPTCLLHTWSPHQQRPFVLVLHLHQHESSRNLHLHYFPKNQSTQRCQSLITQGSDHLPVLEPHMVHTLTHYPLKEIQRGTPSNLRIERRTKKPREDSENHRKRETGGVTRSCLPPQHPSLSQDLSMKLSS
jgi:hypothetical protein